MVFLRRSPHSVSEQGQKSRAKLYSSGTRSKKRRRALWHFWRLQLLSVVAARLVHATTYSDRREPHFSYRPQSWAAFRHWFWPSKEREEAEEDSGVRQSTVLYIRRVGGSTSSVFILCPKRNLPDMMEAIRDISMFLTRFSFSSSYGDTSYSSYAKKIRGEPSGPWAWALQVVVQVLWNGVLRRSYKHLILPAITVWVNFNGFGWEKCLFPKHWDKIFFYTSVIVLFLQNHQL